MYTQVYTSVNEYYIYTQLHTALHMPHASIFHSYTHPVLQVSSPMTVEVVTDTSQSQVRSPVDRSEIPGVLMVLPSGNLT